MWLRQINGNRRKISAGRTLIGLVFGNWSSPGNIKESEQVICSAKQFSRLDLETSFYRAESLLGQREVADQIEARDELIAIQSSIAA